MHCSEGCDVAGRVEGAIEPALINTSEQEAVCSVFGSKKTS